jgi:hypothetical protein
MVFWSGYGRFVRSGSVCCIWVRRARCRRCRRSHSLLPSFCLLGRLDVVEVIVPTVAAVGKGSGVRKLADAGGVPHTTARSWWRRYRRRAALLLSAVVAGAAAVGVVLSGLTGVAEVDAVQGWEAVGVTVSGEVGVGVWAAVSLLSAGAWLSTTMNTPWAADPEWRLMLVMVKHCSRVPP